MAKQASTEIPAELASFATCPWIRMTNDCGYELCLSAEVAIRVVHYRPGRWGIWFGPHYIMSGHTLRWAVWHCESWLRELK